MSLLPEHAWTAREREHRRRVDAAVAGHRERAAAGTPHPVEDFLFTYYSLRPAQLRRWHPGAGTSLAGEPARARLAWRDHAEVGGGVGLDVAAFAARRGGAVGQVRALLAATAARPAYLGCFGLHEWAMVYRQPASDVRHAGWPLRLGPAGTDAVVEAHRIRCTHHDAFRFFTAEARPRNAVQPARSDQLAFEQPGCVHATMDLYKWAYKLGPAVPGELLLDCFDLARAARAVDMRAAPYDLTALGYRPIPIETAAGRAEYAAAQRELAERAAPLRQRLLEICGAVQQAARPGAFLEA